MRPALTLAGAVVVVATLSLGAAPALADSCPNAAFRVGPSANLPDCRAYELVTPQDTNGFGPDSGIGAFFNEQVDLGDLWSTSPVSTDGDAFAFEMAATVLPGFDGLGLNNNYRADRGSNGWTTSAWGPTGAQAKVAPSGGASSDLGYHAIQVGGGSLAGSSSDGVHYIRYPDGSYHLVGAGTVPANPDTDGFPDGFVDDPLAVARFITAGATHEIFSTLHANGIGPALTPNAPSNASAVYDRTPTALHLVSLLPGDTTPTGNSALAGVSDDGSVVAFETGGNMYVRINNASTQLIAPGQISDVGWVTDSKVIYSQAGNLFSYDLATQTSTPISASGDAQFVRVSDDASHVFFESPSQLDAGMGSAGQPNLYVWDGGGTHFIATVNPSDLTHSDTTVDGVDGLIGWEDRSENGAAPAQRQEEWESSSRATPEGRFFAFISTADLTGQNPNGVREIYRYDSVTSHLDCVSCPPDGSDGTADSSFRDPLLRATGTDSLIPNVAADGTVFFESKQDLLPQDVDGVSDVYEWKDGTLSLLSTGQSTLNNHLVAATPDGSEVFIQSADQLVPNAQEPGIPAVYALRVDGGFPPPPPAGPAACTGDACKSVSGGAPPMPSIGSVTFVGSGNGTPGGSSKATGKVQITGRVVTGTSFTLTVRTPGAGRIRVSGTGIRAMSRQVRAAGSYNLKLALTGGARSALKKRKALKVSVTVRFSPAVGSTSSRTVSFLVHERNVRKSGRRSTTRGVSR